MQAYYLRLRDAEAEYHNAHRREGTFSPDVKITPKEFRDAFARGLTPATQQFIVTHGDGRTPKVNLYSSVADLRAMMRNIDPNKSIAIYDVRENIEIRNLRISKIKYFKLKNRNS